ncbi:vWA domain-containing protein [Haliangium ochraceum]|uniref:von Willebrand factor type A n=1 Tax=Haliangium ochraceum (strain DSM 14365 / JCM 11303 / SMP-2) TaxID=502025 RepID=D0LYZ5_HALO1|nr:vWA domain-containing protein [Haliangium ochraceum]ACY14465.1 von Willebrand factor type A [Haliangium ochraceum DSM 14365]
MLARRWSLLFASMLWLAACGGSGGDGTPDAGGGGGGGDGGNGDCVGGSECGKPCTSDSTCSLGYYCGPDNTCTADCRRNTDDCGAGQYCDSLGQCQEGELPPDAAVDCPNIEVETDPIIPTVQFLIDFSGSMDQNFGGIKRSQAVRNALFDEDDGVVALLQSQVRFGASLYTSFDGNEAPPCPRLTQVAPAFNNLTALRADIGGPLNDPPNAGDTPTGESIDAIAENFPDNGPNDKPLIVLATDGEPDSCTDPDPNTDPGRAATRRLSEEATQRAFEAGIELYVLSVGNDVGADHLQRVANAGVGKALDESNDPATVYIGNNQQELVDAFSEIIRSARSCEFTLAGTVTDPEGGTVSLNGELLEYETDWVIGDDGGSLELIGAACESYINATETAVIKAEFSCDSVIDIPIE